MFSPMEYKEAISENIPKNLMINHKLFSYKHIFSDITVLKLKLKQQMGSGRCVRL